MAKLINRIPVSIKFEDHMFDGVFNYTTIQGLQQVARENIGLTSLTSGVGLSKYWDASSDTAVSIPNGLSLITGLSSSTTPSATLYNTAMNSVMVSYATDIYELGTSSYQESPAGTPVYPTFGPTSVLSIDLSDANVTPSLFFGSDGIFYRKRIDNDAVSGGVFKGGWSRVLLQKPASSNSYNAIVGANFGLDNNIGGIIGLSVGYGLDSNIPRYTAFLLPYGYPYIEHTTSYIVASDNSAITHYLPSVSGILALDTKPAKCITSIPLYNKLNTTWCWNAYGAKSVAVPEIPYGTNKRYPYNIVLLGSGTDADGARHHQDMTMTIDHMIFTPKAELTSRICVYLHASPVNWNLSDESNYKGQWWYGDWGSYSVKWSATCSYIWSTTETSIVYPDRTSTVLKADVANGLTVGRMVFSGTSDLIKTSDKSLVCMFDDFFGSNDKIFSRVDLNMSVTFRSSTGVAAQYDVNTTIHTHWPNGESNDACDIVYCTADAYAGND